MTAAVHASNIKQWYDCQRRWWFSDSEWGLGYQPKIEPEPMTFGSWIHETLQHHYDNGTDLSETFKEIADKTWNAWTETALTEKYEYLVERWHRMRQLGLVMLHYYKQWQSFYTGTAADQELEFLACEKSFKLPLSPQGTVAGIWDGIVRWRGALWVFETKTTSRPEELLKNIEFSWQPRIYTWAAQQIYGEDVAGVIYNVMIKADPYNVKVLQSGWPSKAKAELEKTTLDVYKQILEETSKRESRPLAETMQEYSSQLDYLSKYVGSLVQRIPLYITSAQVDATEKMLPVIWQRMSESSHTPIPVLDLYGQCPYCPYKFACQAMDDGTDWESILQVTMKKEAH